MQSLFEKHEASVDRSLPRKAARWPALLALAGVLAGCDGGEGSGDVQGGGGSPATTSSPAGGSGGGGGSGGTGGSTDPGPCPPATLCLQPFLIVPEKPQQPGRLTIVWFQIMDIDSPTATGVAYDVPFEPGHARYDIPLAEIATPPPTSTLLCQWENGTCLMNANPKPAGLGLPIVLDDSNGNGKIDAAEVTLYGNHGVGMAYVVWSKDGAAPGSDELGFTEEIFPEGLAAGLHYYPVNGVFDATLGAADTGGPFDLALCPSAGQDCQVVGPQLNYATYP